MVTSFLQLDHSLAVVAPLPALLLGHLDQAGCLIVLGALSSGVIFATTTNTYLGAASPTTSIFSSSGHISLDFARLDPITAAFRRAIEVLRSRILFKFLIPKPLELIIKQTIYVLQRDMLLGAAARGHVLRILDGQRELALQACVAHAMTTCKLCGLSDGKIIVHTDQTVNPGRVSPGRKHGRKIEYL